MLHSSVSDLATSGVAGKIRTIWLAPSTWVALIASAALLFLLEIPGRRSGPTTYAHGWPFAYLTRDYTADNEFSRWWKSYPDEWAKSREPRWDLEEKMDPWSASNIVVFSQLAVAFDIVAVIVAILIIAVVVQRWNSRPRTMPRRRFQFKLRTLLLVVTILAATSGKVASWYHDYCTEERTLEKLKSLGSFLYVGKVWTAPRWLPESLLKVGPFARLFCQVDVICLYSSHIDKTLPLVASLTKLRRLTLYVSRTSELELRDMPNLASLECNSEDRRLFVVRLRGMSGLRHLAIHTTEPSDSFHGFPLAPGPPSPLTIEGLSRLSNLKELEIRNCRPDNVTVGELSKLENLVSLNVKNSWLNDSDVESLSPLIGLQDVDLSGTDVTSHCLDALAAMQCLRKANFEGTVISSNDQALARLREALPNLSVACLPSSCSDAEQAKIRQSELRAATSNWRPSLPNLRDEDLNALNMSIADLRALWELPPLDEALKTNPRDRVAKRITTLNLCETRITDAGLRHLSEMTNLERLDLSWTHITDTGLARLAHLESLKTLALDGTCIHGPGLLNLSNLPSLTALSLGGTPLTDEGLAALTSLRKLEVLRLSDTLISDAGIESLVGLDHLRVLNLNTTDLTDGAVPHLKKIRSLRSLVIESTKISERGKAEIKEAIPEISFDRW